MKYAWMVVEQQTEVVPGGELPEIQCGVVGTFKEALGALSAWQGAEDDPPHRLYQILPMGGKEDEDG